MRETTAQKRKTLKPGMRVTTWDLLRLNTEFTLLRIVDLKSADNDTGLRAESKLRYVAECMHDGATKSVFVPLGVVNVRKAFDDELKWMQDQSNKFMCFQRGESNE